MGQAVQTVGRRAAAPSGDPGPSEAAGWTDPVVGLVHRRLESYGVLFDQMRASRSLVELGAAQQRWWLSAVRDYMGFAASLYDVGGAARDEDPGSS